jgi:hypothetical protein
MPIKIGYLRNSGPRRCQMAVGPSVVSVWCLLLPQRLRPEILGRSGLLSSCSARLASQGPNPARPARRRCPATVHGRPGTGAASTRRAHGHFSGRGARGFCGQALRTAITRFSDDDVGGVDCGRPECACWIVPGGGHRQRQRPLFRWSCCPATGGEDHERTWLPRRPGWDCGRRGSRVTGQATAPWGHRRHRCGSRSR